MCFFFVTETSYDLHVSSSQSIGVAVGVSLSLLVVCTVCGVLMLRWAIRKGYLRHVAASYKNFRNSTDRDDTQHGHDTEHGRDAGAPTVSYTGGGTSRAEDVQVHI